MHWGQLAHSGAAALTIEATSVSAQGRISPGDWGLHCDETPDALGKSLSIATAHSPIIVCIQLSHAGRKGSTHRPWDGSGQVGATQGGWQTVAPSAVPYAEKELAPLQLDEAQIQQLIADFASSAARAVQLGLKYIEVHAAHGYVLHQFLSPLTNLRRDSYGGSLLGRMRLCLKVFDAIKAAVPADFVVGLRVSATDWAEGGWDLIQTITLLKELVGHGCSFAHVSSGGLVSHQKIPVGPNDQVPFAQAVKQEVDMPTIAVGMITEPAQVDTIIAAQQADLVALARGILYDPRWPWHAAAALGDTVYAAKQYHRSQPRRYAHLFWVTH